MQAITHENGDTTFILKPWEIKAILAFALKDDARAAMNSVCFERDGSEARIVATDGHRLTLATVNARENDADDGAPQFAHVPTPKASLVRVATLLDAAKATPKGHELHVRPNCTRAAMAVKPEPGNYRPGACPTLDVALVDAQFPPWRQVVPADVETPRAQAFGVNAGYLADLALFAKRCHARTGGIRIVPPVAPGGTEKDAIDPLVATTTDENSGTAWTCVLMPMRM